MDVNSEVKLTSKWTNAMKSTNNTKRRSNKLMSILRQITIAAGKKNLDPDQFNVAVLKAKYNELVEMKGKPASDWVVKLGEECYILYDCVGCNLHLPVQTSGTAAAQNHSF